MFENIDLIKDHGANPHIPGFGYGRIVVCYEYFMDNGFISGFVKPNLKGLNTKEMREVVRNALMKSTITPRGYVLISAERQSNTDKLVPTKITASGKIGVGPVEAHAEAEFGRKNALQISN